MQYVAESIRRQIVIDLTGTGGVFEVINATPFKGTVTPGDAVTLADMQLKDATFAGSAPKVVTLSGLAKADNGNYFKESQLLLWIATADPATPEAINGVYYDDGVDLLGIDLFATPKTIAKQYDSVQHIVTTP